MIASEIAEAANGNTILSSSTVAYRDKMDGLQWVFRLVMS